MFPQVCNLHLRPRSLVSVSQIQFLPTQLLRHSCENTAGSSLDVYAPPHSPTQSRPQQMAILSPFSSQDRMLKVPSKKQIRMRISSIAAIT